MMSALVNGVSMAVETSWTYQVFSTSLIAALAFNAYDWLLTFANEWKYIWSLHHKNPKLHVWIKALFVVLRYMSLGSQLVHCVWNSYFMSMYPVSPPICRNFHIFNLVSLLIQLSIIDCMMILRAWLVFNRGAKSLFLLLLALFCQLGIIFMVIFCLFLRVKFDMDGLCGPWVPLSLFTPFWLGAFIVHTTSWAFTMYQCRRARKQGCGITPLIQLLERDGTCFWVSFGVTVAIGVTIGYRISTTVASMVDPWVVSLTSVLGCRMIMNFQSLADGENNNIELHPSVMFTTIVPSYMSNTAWSKVDGQLVDTFIDAHN